MFTKIHISAYAALVAVIAMLGIQNSGLRKKLEKSQKELVTEQVKTATIYDSLEAIEARRTYADSLRQTNSAEYEIIKDSIHRANAGDLERIIRGQIAGGQLQVQP